MISLKWVSVILWAILGLVVLIAPKRVSKIEYGCVWFALMANLIEKAMNV